MRTIFVNPRHRKTRKKARKHSRRKRNPSTQGTSLAAYKKGLSDAMQIKNPSRRRRHRKSAPKRARARRRHRRNAGIVPFIGNPGMARRSYRIVRRRRRSNPSMKLNVKSVASKALQLGGGAGIGLALNMYAINKIDNKWMRHGARLAAAIGAGMLLKGKWADMGTAAAGAVLYPTLQSIALKYVATDAASAAAVAPSARELAWDYEPPAGTHADLDVLSADLNEALSDYEDEEDDLF